MNVNLPTFCEQEYLSILLFFLPRFSPIRSRPTSRTPSPVTGLGLGSSASAANVSSYLNFSFFSRVCTVSGGTGQSISISPAGGGESLLGMDLTERMRRWKRLLDGYISFRCLQT